MSFIKSWANNQNNIYKLNKRDGIFYLLCNILIPVMVTGFSIGEDSLDGISIVYLYLSILISAVNIIYDITNRWKSKRKCLINTKLFIMALPVFIIIGYCMFEMFYIISTKQVGYRYDNLLYIFFITIAVALFDIFACFRQDMAFEECVKSPKL